MNLRRILLSALVIGLIATGTCLAAGKAEAPTTVPATEAAGKITVWAWPSADKGFEAIIEGFKAKYPKVEVEWIMKPGLAGGTRDALQAALAAGSGAPDVVLIEINDIGTFAMSEGFVNLLDKPYDAGKYKTDLVGYKWDLSLTPTGQLFAFPWDIGPACMYYRRDLMEAAGLPSDPEALGKLIRTWDDYVAVGKKVNNPGKNVYWTDNASSIPYIYYAHKNLFDKNLNIAIDNATTRRVMTIATQLRKAGMDAKAGAWTDEWYTMLNKGQIATVISGSWFGGFLKGWIAAETAGKWGILPIPEEPLQNWGGSFLAVPKQSKNPVAAWRFIEYVCADPAAANAIMKTIDYFPSLISAWNDPLYDEPDPFFGGQKTRRVWANIAKSQGPFVVTPLDMIAEGAFNTELAKYLDQGLELESTIKEMVRQIEIKTQTERRIVLQMMGKK